MADSPMLTPIPIRPPLFTSGVGVGVAVVTCVLGIGTDFELVMPVSAALGLALFLLHFPYTCQWRFPKLVGKSWFSSEAALSLTGLVFVTAAGATIPFVGRFPLSYVPGLGYVMCIIHVGIAFRRQPPKLLSIVGTMVFATTIAAVFFGLASYKNPLYLSSLHFGFGNTDELYHASVCAMIRTYGVPATGLDGVLFSQYHFGSHWIFAQLCNLLEQSPLEFYNVSYPVIFGPYLLECFLLFMRTIGTGTARTLSNLAWLCFFVGCAGFVLAMFEYYILVSAWIDFISESTALGIAVSFLGTAALFDYLKRRRRNALRLEISDLLAAVLFPVLVGAIGFLKASMPPLLLVMGVYGFARLPRFRTGLNAFMLAASAAAAYVVSKFTIPTVENNFHLQAFGLQRMFLEPALWPSHFILNYFWTWFFVLLRLGQEDCRSFGDVARLIHARKWIDVELLVVAAAAGALPGLLGIGGFNGRYFADYQRWLGLCLVCDWLTERARHGTYWPSPLRPSIRLCWTMVLVLGVLLSLTNSLIFVRRSLRDNFMARGWTEPSPIADARVLPSPFDLWKPSELKRISDVNHQLQSWVKGPDNEASKILRVLNELAAYPRREKQRSLLYIPRSTTLYWKLLKKATYVDPIMAAAFVAPAITEIAMVDGLPSYSSAISDDHWEMAGLSSYGPQAVKKRQSVSDPTEADLAKRAQQMGFTQLITLVQDADGNVQIIKRNL